MRGFRVVLWLGMAAASSVLALACTSVRWSGGRQVPYRMPQRFYLWVDASEQVNATVRRMAVGELADALHRDIWRRGYDVDLVTSADGRDRYPRVEVLVRSWKSGTDEVQFFKGFGEAQIDADCSVRLSPSVGPVFLGHLKGQLDLSDYGPSATGPFDAAAGVIAEAMLGPNVRNRPAPAHSAPAETAPPSATNVVHAPPPLVSEPAAVLAVHSRPGSSRARPATAPAPTQPPAASPPPAATPTVVVALPAPASPPVASFPVSPTSTAPAVPTMSFPPE